MYIRNFEISVEIHTIWRLRSHLRPYNERWQCEFSIKNLKSGQTIELGFGEILNPTHSAV